MNNAFKGIVVPIITPYQRDLSLDLHGFESVFSYFDQNPDVDGLFITGATGEYDVLSVAERKQIIDLAIDMNLQKDWIPNTSTREKDSTLDLTEYALSRGVDTIGLIFPKECATFLDVQAFLKQILSLGPRVFIYQTGNTPYPLSVQELRELADMGPVIGIKDSCSPRDMYRHIQYISQLGDHLTVIQGVEMLYLPSLSMGVHGVIGGGCNVYPQLFQQISQAYDAGENKKAALLQKKVNEYIELIYSEGTGIESMKYFLSLCDVKIQTLSRKTITPLSPYKKEMMRALYHQLH